MRYYVNLFSPATAIGFTNSDQTITGFRPSRKSYVQNQNIKKGDRFICYCTKIQRFIGLYEVLDSFFEDDTPIFQESEDPFTLRFKIKVLVWLPFEKGIPIHDSSIWPELSFTKDLSSDSTAWTYMVFSSPKAWPLKDAKLLERVLLNQANEQKTYPLTEQDEKKIKINKIRINDKKEVIVSIPDSEIPTIPESQNEVYESLKIQASLSEIGEKLGFKIWLPKSDRSRIHKLWKPKQEDTIPDNLPFSYNDVTIKTIYNIDVIWIKNRTIIRAFEVEGTTSIYSGILRMADLLALQPNLDIKATIVAPESRRELVFEQINRPVFSLMENGALADKCSFISYDSIYEIKKIKNLKHTKESILDEFIKFAKDE